MHCLDLDAIDALFEKVGVRRDEQGYPTFRSGSDQRGSLKFGLPKDVGGLRALTDRVVDWLPVETPRIFCLRYWNTYPPTETILFERVRLASGESRSINEAPAHVFCPVHHGPTQYEGRSQDEHTENAILAGLLFLSIASGWEGYAFGELCDDFFFFGDEFIEFSTTSKRAAQDAAKLGDQFSLPKKT